MKHHFLNALGEGGTKRSRFIKIPGKGVKSREKWAGQKEMRKNYRLKHRRENTRQRKMRMERKNREKDDKGDAICWILH